MDFKVRGGYAVWHFLESLTFPKTIDQSQPNSQVN